MKDDPPGDIVGTGNLRPIFEATPDELVALLGTVQDDLELSDIASCVVLDDDIREAARTVLGRRRRRIRSVPGRSAKMAHTTELTRQN